LNSDIKSLLEGVQNGSVSVEDALLKIKKQPFEDLGYAKVDLHRKARQGAAEVIYGAGKTPEQITGIVRSLQKADTNTILITRLDEEKARAVSAEIPFDYRKDARIGIVGKLPEPDGIGTIVVATGGTSDIPVAEEAALTAEALGNKVCRLYDVGVAGLHRTLAHMDEIMSATVIIAIAGMEGALASVIGGLADCPVIAVPTSVGYGASFHGLSALLSMLNSCASGVSVVNIDNGFGAGYQASMINHVEAK
jgi:NCAIR mutase (PurE)-related protein